MEEEEEETKTPNSKSLTIPDDVPKERIEEANEVKELLKSMAKQVEPGSKWFIISMKWIDQLQKYLYLDYLTGSPQEISDSERTKPGPITNEDIILDLPKG